MRLINIGPYSGAKSANKDTTGKPIIEELIDNIRSRGQLEGVEIDTDTGTTIPAKDGRDDDVLAHISVGVIEKIREYSAMNKYDAIVCPVFAGSSTKNIGITKFLDALVADCPSPAEVAPKIAKNASGEEELAADPSAALAALVFKTAADPFVGRLTYLRIVSGTLKGDSHVWNANHSVDERIGQLILMKGKTQDHAPTLAAQSFSVAESTPGAGQIVVATLAPTSSR